ncbi:predicted protein [Chaetoceros tenuissimus]|uniref:Uncharacterized protein n=1 Tax=Chaetoceros tenuissimus TaxID=426638 RepID=A0AAD3CR67_9STRA|nr:predicted protein [Chaetoceros tenuissimus]
MANLNTFQLVQEFISNQLKSIFPPQEIHAAKKGRRVAVTKRQKKQAKQARKHKAACIAKLSINDRTENGVQLQGYAHYYSNKDFHALTQDTRDAILKARRDNNWVPGNRNDRDRNVDATATGNRNDDDVSSVGHSLAGRTITMDASVLRGVMATSSSTGDEQQQTNPPSNGSHARSTESAGLVWDGLKELQLGISSLAWMLMTMDSEIRQWNGFTLHGIIGKSSETVLFQISSLKEEQRTKHDWSWEHSKLDLPLHHLVSLVERPNGVQVPVFRDDTFISEFDRGLCHASSGLAQDLAVDSLVNSAKVQLKDSARIALASTEKQHHEVTKELLAKKWGISVSRAEATLKASISYQCDLLSCL